MKPEFMRLRRAVAGALTALLLSVGIVALSPALSASAHHNTINVSASCVDYVWTITWKITNSERDKSETITSSNDQNIIATGTTIGKGDTHTKTETVSGPVNKTLTVTGKWSNGVTHTASKTISKSDFKGTCEVPDNAKIKITADTCTTPGGSSGTISYSLSGVTKSYAVKLMSGATTVMQTSSSGGNGVFSSVPAGTYTITASATGEKSATSASVTVTECAPVAPDVAINVNPCLAGGTAGTVTVSLSKLTVGSTYELALFSTTAGELETLPLTATATTFSHTFASHGPGTYYVEVTDPAGALLTKSANASVLACADDPTISVQLEPCPLATGPTPAERDISVTVDDLVASTVYTVQLVTDDAAGTVVATTTTPGSTATTFSHTFTNVPAPGDYRVKVIGASTTLTSDPISAPLCDLPTMAPPSIELAAPICDDVTSPEVLTASMIDLDATKTYYVRIVDSTGATVPGGDDQTVTGSTTATLTFPLVPVPGTYTAQLLIDPGKQLAATSGGSTDLTVCLPTLAMTGPGVLIPLGSVAALLLTLGGAVVTGRLRRRMAL